jgi:hypothetical protein
MEGEQLSKTSKHAKPTARADRGRLAVSPSFSVLAGDPGSLALASGRI